MCYIFVLVSRAMKKQKLGVGVGSGDDEERRVEPTPIPSHRISHIESYISRHNALSCVMTERDLDSYARG